MNTFLFVLLVIALCLLSLSEAKAKRVRLAKRAADAVDCYDNGDGYYYQTGTNAACCWNDGDNTFRLCAADEEQSYDPDADLSDAPLVDQTAGTSSSAGVSSVGPPAGP